MGIALHAIATHDHDEGPAANYKYSYIPDTTSYRT